MMNSELRRRYPDFTCKKTESHNIHQKKVKQLTIFYKSINYRFTELQNLQTQENLQNMKKRRIICYTCIGKDAQHHEKTDQHKAS